MSCSEAATLSHRTQATRFASSSAAPTAGGNTRAVGAGALDRSGKELTMTRSTSEPVVDEEPWLVPYEDIVDSVKIAMESAGVSTDQIAEVLATVQDFAVNYLGDD
jgi:hypothetical protein